MSDRGIELVHAEIDDRLAGAERAELGRLLLADPQLRALRDQLRRTCAALDAMPQEEAPPDLHDSILRALPAAPVDCSPPAQRRAAPSWMRYAAALAGGALVTLLGFQLVDDSWHGVGSGDVTGTITPARAPAQLVLAHPGATGTVTVRDRGRPVVVARISARAPIQVIARLGQETVRLEGFVAPQDAPVELSASFPAAGKAREVRVEVLDAAGRRLESGMLGAAGKDSE
jgi:hypothetical protein